MAPRKPRPMRKQRNANATASQLEVEDEGQQVNTTEQEQAEPMDVPLPSPRPKVTTTRKTPKLRNHRQARRIERFQTAENIGDAVKNLPPDLISNLGLLFCNLYIEKYKASRVAQDEDEEDEGRDV